MLEFKNISKSFKTAGGIKTVFEDFNMTVLEGEFISIIGTNGAGKSTLVKILVGDETVDQGEILLKGNAIQKLPSFVRKKRIAKVYQDPSKGTAGEMTILENLSLADQKGKKIGLSFGLKKNRYSYYMNLLKELNLGLEEQMQTKVKELSGGQRQALALIMATMHVPEVLVLDEHTSALDPITAKVVMEKTKQLVEKYQMPTLMITHNMESALGYANRLVKLDGGKIVLDIDLTDKEAMKNTVLFQ